LEPGVSPTECPPWGSENVTGDKASDHASTTHGDGDRGKTCLDGTIPCPRRLTASESKPRGSFTSDRGEGQLQMKLKPSADPPAAPGPARVDRLLVRPGTRLYDSILRVDHQLTG